MIFHRGTPCELPLGHDRELFTRGNIGAKLRGQYDVGGDDKRPGQYDVVGDDARTSPP
jgi:hypothetical protein